MEINAVVSRALCCRVGFACVLLLVSPLQRPIGAGWDYRWHAPGGSQRGVLQNSVFCAFSEEKTATFREGLWGGV